MSHIDVQDFEYPPGLFTLPSRNNNNGERIQSGYHQRTMFSTADRRPSNGILNQPAYSEAVPRSLSVQKREYGFGMEGEPNRHNPSSPILNQAVQPFSSFNRHLPHLSSSPPTQNPPYNLATLNDRDAQIHRNNNTSNPTTPPLPATNHPNRTIWWSELEPWMDEEYVKQVCGLMGWDPVSIKVPQPAPDPITGQQANNPGFCYLTFPAATQAASVLSQINGSNGAQITMPNSLKPFMLNWASSVPSVSPTPNPFIHGTGTGTGSLQQYPKEYSIFVGDLAPETSNSDLVAVFRNPVLGLRNDREPKFIRPFLSCKSAKIMLDPVTGVSRGYGFVRFTDEADQQRALIEMHGLYCLSRPMRISPATAKYKAPPNAEFPQTNSLEQQKHVTIALPLPNSNLTKSVSVPMATATSTASFSSSSNGVSTSGSGSSIGTLNSSSSLSSGSNTSISSSGLGSVASDDMINLPHNVLVQIAQQYASGESTPLKVNSGTSITQGFTQDTPIRQSFGQGEGGAPRYTISEESWKHHAQARAILGNLIGPNGEQLTSTDPYNTTVFVGGLSPLISEETLRTFFSPFGDIHYVKVPVGKHCGFVQFVRKSDAERAIEKMQGFPIGGSRIRLSWGRSQYKAAQAAAQAAQAAAMQTQFSAPAAPNMMTQEQAIQLLQKLTLQGYIDGIPSVLTDNGADNTRISGNYANLISDGIFGEGKNPQSTSGTREEGHHIFESYPSSTGFLAHPDTHRPQSTFSPFSPDPNIPASDVRRESFSRSETLPHPSKTYAPGFFPLQSQDPKLNTSASATANHSPPSTRPTSASRYNTFLESSNSFGVSRAPGKPEGPISRPSSGHTSADCQEPKEFDILQDLNGTLASLDLDRSWKLQPENLITSTGSVQFRVMKDRTPPPLT